VHTILKDQLDAEGIHYMQGTRAAQMATRTQGRRSGIQRQLLPEGFCGPVRVGQLVNSGWSCLPGWLLIRFSFSFGCPRRKEQLHSSPLFSCLSTPYLGPDSSVILSQSWATKGAPAPWTSACPVDFSLPHGLQPGTGQRLQQESSTRMHSVLSSQRCCLERELYSS
jgi:hypothetical protein